jgi:hypothetical protein
MLKNLLL